MTIFTAISYWIEILATYKVHRFIIYTLIVLNQIALLVYPIYLSFKVESSPLFGSLFILYAVTTNLKLISFHHTMNDVRSLVLRLIKAKIDGISLEPNKIEGTILGVPKLTYDRAVTYPKCLNVSDFLRFMLAPTMCY